MSFLSTNDFAAMAGVCERVARKAFAKGTWRGQPLPVLQVSGNGGASGMVWGLALDRASPELRALLKLPETLPSIPVERRLKGRPDDRHVTSAVDKQRIIAAIVAHPKGSHQRAAAFRVPDEETFDLVFSKEVHRDVRKGSIKIDNRAYHGSVLAELIGERQVPFLVPLRGPEGPIIFFKNNVIHRLCAETFALNDRDGAKHKGTVIRLQKTEIKRRIATAGTHRRAHRSGHPSRIDADPELRAFVSARLDTLTFDQTATDIAAHFPPNRRVSRSSIHRWWQKSRGY